MPAPVVALPVVALPPLACPARTRMMTSDQAGLLLLLCREAGVGFQHGHSEEQAAALIAALHACTGRGAPRI